MLEKISLLSLLFCDKSFILYNKYLLLLSKKLGLISCYINYATIKKRIWAIWQNKFIIGLDILFPAIFD